MANEMKHGIINTVSGILITVILGGLGYIAINVQKIPEVVEKVDNIGASLVELMQKTGYAPNTETIKKLTENNLAPLGATEKAMYKNTNVSEIQAHGKDAAEERVVVISPASTKFLTSNCISRKEIEAVIKDIFEQYNIPKKEPQ